MMKPTWDESPVWANWLAQDADGMWCFYEFRPVKDDHAWIPEDYSKFEEIRNSEANYFCWKDTLEHRPSNNDIAMLTDNNSDVVITRVKT